LNSYTYLHGDGAALTVAAVAGKQAIGDAQGTVLAGEDSPPLALRGSLSRGSVIELPVAVGIVVLEGTGNNQGRSSFQVNRRPIPSIGITIGRIVLVGASAGLVVLEDATNQLGHHVLAGARCNPTVRLKVQCAAVPIGG
jgi:hypothetical protein